MSRPWGFRPVARHQAIYSVAQEEIDRQQDGYAGCQGFPLLWGTDQGKYQPSQHRHQDNYPLRPEQVPHLQGQARQGIPPEAQPSGIRADEQHSPNTRKKAAGI